MESKKLNKKFNSFFWFLLGSLPLFVFLILFVGYLFVYKETGSSVLFEENFNILESTLVHVNSVFNNFKWEVIFNALSDTFILIGVEVDNSLCMFGLLLFTWFVQVSFFHLLIDFLLMVPRACHAFIERWS